MIEPEVVDLAEHAKKLGISKVLDVGCGIGRHTIYLARLGFEVHGIDQSASAIKRALDGLHREKLHAKLRVHNFSKALPYADNTFSLVLSTRAIHHMPCVDVSRAIGELDRVLAHGGFIFLQVPSMEKDEAFLRSGGGPGWHVHFIDPHTVVPEDGEEAGVSHHYFTIDELRTLLPNYVFENLHVASDHYHGYCLVARKSSRKPTP